MCCVDRLSRLHKTDMAATFGDVRYREKSRLALTGSDRLAFARRANHFVFSEMACPAPFAKIFSFAPGPNQMHDSRYPVPHRGAWSRHERGAGCGGSGPCPWRTYLTRTAKSCRYVSPMLAYSLR